MMQEDFIEIDKQFPSIREFTDMIHSYNGATKKQAHNGKFNWKNDQEQVDFYYLLLGEDVVIWDQEVKIEKNQKIYLFPREEDKPNYLFNFFFNSNQALFLEGGNVFGDKNLILSNNHGEYRFMMPKGYEGHILQIVITDSFLKSYVPRAYLKNPILEKIIYRKDKAPLIIENPPAYVQAELLKIKEQLRAKGAGIQNKLPLLQLVARFVETFFVEYLGKQAPNSKILLEKEFKSEVKKLFRKYTDRPFMGVPYLAQQFDLSTSTFKRLFEKHFNLTPLQYFKRGQMQYAQKLLKTGNYKVIDVSYQLGYTMDANFIRTYKQYIGHSPGQDLP